MLGMVRGLVVGLVDSGSLLHWDRARMLAKRSVEKKRQLQLLGRIAQLPSEDVMRKCVFRKRWLYPELLCNGPQRLVVLGSEVGGRWGTGALALVRDFVRLRRLRAPPALRHAAATAWAWRWWTQLSVAVQRATALSAAGRAWPAASRAAADAPAFELVLDLADAAGPSMLPFRA